MPPADVSVEKGGKVILIKGADPTFVASALKASLENYGAASAVTEEFDAVAEQLPMAIEACLTTPFLSPVRYVVIRNLGALKADDLAPLTSYLSDMSPTAVLFLVGGGGTLSPVISRAVTAAGGDLVESAPSTDTRGRSNWIASALKASGLKFDATARVALTDHLGEDLGRLQALLSTLISTWGAGAKIGLEELSPYLGEAGGVAPWDLTDAIAAGDVSKALIAAQRMMGGGDRHPLVLLSVLHRHFSSILRLTAGDAGTEAEAAAILGIKAFPAGKLLVQAQKLGYYKAAKAIKLLADADLDMKGASGWDPSLVAEVLVARLARIS